MNKCLKHEWVIFSTALGEGWLMLQCVECGLHATVDDPSREEWAQAFHAPAKPYLWHDDNRIVIHEEIPTDQPNVQKKPPTAKRCECYSRLGMVEPGEYERVWIEVTRPRPEVMEEARQELLHLAELADGADDLCSTFFPLFIASYQQATGSEPSHAVRWLVNQLKKLPGPAHCSSSVVARLLREVAKV